MSAQRFILFYYKIVHLYIKPKNQPINLKIKQLALQYIKICNNY